MPAPRLPVEKAAITGADKKNPGRFKDRKKPRYTQPLGEPYARMSDTEKAVWAEVKAEIPWLNSSHRRVVRLVCRYEVALDEAPKLNAQLGAGLLQLLKTLGATPTEETKIDDLSRFGHVGDDPEQPAGEPEDRFFGEAARPN